VHVQFALPKWPTNYFNLFQQTRQHVLRAYCPNIYTVITGRSRFFHTSADSLFNGEPMVTLMEASDDGEDLQGMYFMAIWVVKFQREGYKIRQNYYILCIDNLSRQILGII
jgi:hypothetical protein